MLARGGAAVLRSVIRWTASAIVGAVGGEASAALRQGGTRAALAVIAAFLIYAAAVLICLAATGFFA
jgi:hypothetical protein